MLVHDDRVAAKQSGRRRGPQAVIARADGDRRGATAQRVGGTPWSERANDVCRVIGLFMDAWHEGLPAEERHILVPLTARIVRTRATPRVEAARALMAADWLVRTYAPAWLNLAGLQEQARRLFDLPPIVEPAQVFRLRAVLAEVSHAANAQARHVDEAAWIRASDDCWASAWAAAYEAARFAAHDPAWVSAAAASRAAAGLAPRTRTRPFKAALQSSAAELVVKMALNGR